MNNFTISIFGNKTLLEIINELKIFSEYKVSHFENLNSYLEETRKLNHLNIFIIDKFNNDFLDKIELNNFPSILISKSLISKNIFKAEFIEQLSMPFSILELEKKIISLISKYKFRQNSVIQLNDYIIDKNERKIKKDALELQLSEKEVNFLIMFSKHKKPMSKEFVLKSVWNYSSESETHTVETHVHRLRKKILKKFGDNNFIKNNNDGYYI